MANILVIQEMPLKTIVRYCTSRLEKVSVGKDVEKLEPSYSYTAIKNVKQFSHYGKQSGSPSQAYHMT